VSAPVRANHLIAALLVVAAVLFVIGVSAETGEDDHSEAPASETVEHSETGEAAESEEAESADEDEERVLGIDVESPLVVGIAVVVSLLLAALAWWRPIRGVLVLAGVVAAAFAVLDLAEVAHQLDENYTGLVLLAAAIVVLHATAAGLAFRQAMTADSERAPATR
jgi:hypothetical protein